MKEIIYVGDPMCSWCWGFSPVLKSIREYLGDRLSLTVLMGGLRVDSAEIWDERFKDFLKHHWVDVHNKTGQPFSHDFFQRKQFAYITEPPCRAVVTMRKLNPENVYSYFESLHQAFYAENQDITEAETLSELAKPYDIDPDHFVETFQSPEIVEKTKMDFDMSKSLGVRGFPSIVLKNGDKHSFLTVGYQPFDALKPSIEMWLAQ